jgi:5'-nucleotidase
MHILLTNDDGVYAPGIHAMYRELCKLGTVTVVAPDGERSSISQAITLNHPIYHRQVHFEPKVRAHAVSGTPTDCVKFGVTMLLKKKPDLLVSGINDGSNDGCSVFYSGTVGAAREGALLGVCSVAVSLDSGTEPDFPRAAKVALKAVRWALKAKMPEGTFLNVNIPDVGASSIKGLVLTRQCRVPIHSEFRQRQDPMGRTYYWLTGRPPAKHKDMGTDTYALQQKYAVMTPVLCDVTDSNFLNRFDRQGAPRS